MSTEAQNSHGMDGSSSDHGTSALRGNLGTGALVMTVIAYNGPMIVLAGVVPIIIAFGNGFGAPATILITGLVMACFAAGLNAMAVRMAQPGAFYTYVTAGIGRSPGLAAGVMALVAYTAVGGGTYPLLALSAQDVLSGTFGIDNVPPWWAFALGAWAIVSFLSLFNIEVSAIFLMVASLAEIVIVSIWNLRVFSDGGPEGRHVDVVGSLFSGSYSMAFLFGILILTGFESLQVFRSETKDHTRTVPRATYTAITLLVSLYIITSYALIVAYGPSKVIDTVGADPTGSLLSSISSYVSPVVGDVANVLLVTSTFASCLAVQSILARYMFSFGRDRIFPRSLGRVNAKHGSPMTASAVAAAIVLPYFAVPALAQMDPTVAFTLILGVSAVALFSLYFWTSVSIVAYFRHRHNRHVGVLQALVLPGVAAVALGTIVLLAVVHFPEVIAQSRSVSNVILLFLAIVVLLSLLLAHWYRKNRPEIYMRIGNQTDLG